MKAFTIILILSTAILLPAPMQIAATTEDPVRTDTVYFAQGRMLAFLLGIVKPEAMEARNRYFQTIFPIASRYQYDLGVAFNVVEPTRGNYHPGFVAISSWPSKKNRQQFLSDPEVPADLADQRRMIWARFDQVFFEDIEREVSFVVRSDKVYVFTNFWVENQSKFDRYLSAFTGRMTVHAGSLLMVLREGKSPKNHLYEPQVMVISQWDNVKSFKDFLITLEQHYPDDGIKNTNEFVTSYVFGFGS